MGCVGMELPITQRNIDTHHHFPSFQNNPVSIFQVVRARRLYMGKSKCQSVYNFDAR